MTPSISITRTPSISITRTPSISITPSNTPKYTVTVNRGNSAARTIGGVSSIVYRLGGGAKTTLLAGITGPTCNTTSLVGTITNVTAGTVLTIGAQIGGTTNQTFGVAGCAGSSTSNCGYTTTPYQVTVNSNITINIKLNVVSGAYTTC